MENKGVCTKSNDTDVSTIMLGNHEKLNGLILLIAWSNEKWINLTKVYELLETEKAKALIGFHCFSGCDTVERFTGKSKRTWTKLFLSSDLDVFKAFQPLPRHVNAEIMHNLEVFTTKVYSKKILKGNNLAELCWNIYLKDLKKKDIENLKQKNRK